VSERQVNLGEGVMVLDGPASFGIHADLTTGTVNLIIDAGPGYRFAVGINSRRARKVEKAIGDAAAIVENAVLVN
jgi:hypothetical protein